jgi:hypothetical protein
LPADPGFEDPPARRAALGLGLIQPTARALFADFIPP